MRVVQLWRDKWTALSGPLSKDHGTLLSAGIAGLGRILGRVERSEFETSVEEGCISYF